MKVRTRDVHMGARAEPICTFFLLTVGVLHDDGKKNSIVASCTLRLGRLGEAVPGRAALVPLIPCGVVDHVS